MDKNPVTKKSFAAQDVELFFDAVQYVPPVVASTAVDVRRERDQRRQGIKPGRKKFTARRET